MKIKPIAFFIACFMAFGLQAQIDRSVQPQPGPAPQINLQKPASFDLKNGMEVLVVEDHSLPKVTARMIIDNTPHLETKPGTASLLGMLLGTGTEKIEKDAFIEEIDFLGATIRYGSESAYANSLSKYFPRIFELMAAGAIHPKFTQEEFDAQKTKLLESLKLDDKNVGAIASRLSGVLAYGRNHPYGQFETEESVQKITLNDVQSYYNNYYVPENAYLVVVGDITENEVKDLVKKYWEGWESAVPPSASLPAVTAAQYTQIDFVNMPNAVQSELRVQNTIDLQMSDEDYFPVLIANQILGGGGLGTYLNMNLREENAFTYGAYSRIGTDQYGASKFTARTSVRNEVTDSAVVQIMKEINRLRTEPAPFKNLNRAKNKYAGNFVLRLEKPSTIARFALNIKTKNLDEDFYKNYLKNINAVSAEDVMRVAKKYLKPEHIRIIVAGKGADVAKNLEELTLLNGKTPPVLYFDKYGNQIEKPTYEKPIPEGVTAETVFADYIKTIGGEEAVKNVESISMKAGTEMRGMKINLEMKQTNKKSAMTISMNGNTLQKTVFNGEGGYKVVRGQKTPFTPEEIAEKKKETAIFPELKPSEATLKKITKINGKDAYAIVLDEDTMLYYDLETGYKIARSETKKIQGKEMKTTTYFSDYQTVDGVKFPFTITQSVGPRKMEMTVTEIKVNEGVTAADFE